MKHLKKFNESHDESNVITLDVLRNLSGETIDWWTSSSKGSCKIRKVNIDKLCPLSIDNIEGPYLSFASMENEILELNGKPVYYKLK